MNGEEAIDILSRHGTDAAVYAGGTDLLNRLKNRLKQAPRLLSGEEMTAREAICCPDGGRLADQSFHFIGPSMRQPDGR
jgi:CO/xanthine dehydrogenase FAD-binding subunit